MAFYNVTAISQKGSETERERGGGSERERERASERERDRQACIPGPFLSYTHVVPLYTHYIHATPPPPLLFTLK